MRALDDSRFRFAVLTLGLFTVLAGDVWRYSITWYGFAVIVLGVSIFSAALLVRHRQDWRIGTLPYPLLAFLALSTVSIFWSFYPGATAVGLAANWLTVLSGVAFAVAFDWATLLRSLGLALRLLLAGSLVFELVVSVFVRQPMLPFWKDYGDGKLAMSLYWSRDLLLEGGKIQGLPGNSALLGFLALLGLIVFGVQLASSKRRRALHVFWMLLAGVCVYLTRSATITVAIVAVVVAAAAIAAFRLAHSARTKALLYGLFAAIAAALIVFGTVFQSQLLSLMGKTDTLTGRTDIWTKVTGLAQERPAFGWGWVSYWAPWVEPFKGLAKEGGVYQYQAHNAWLDLWLQLGVIGVVVFGALFVSSVVRAWFFATDRPQFEPGHQRAYSAVSALPLLVLTALAVQSLVESRLIIEYGIVLLVIVAVKTKRGDPVERL